MRVVVIGMGVQGHKRKAVAGKDVVATIDPINQDADFSSITEIDADTYDAALICTPDEAKFELLTCLIKNKKHVLVEKPLLGKTDDEIESLMQQAQHGGVVCYTAYNHRFEPHFVRMREHIQNGSLGRIYSIRMFYGNGTARLVRDSAWRDQAAGVLPDLGSHLLDTLRFWLGDDQDLALNVTAAYKHENNAFDHVILGSEGDLAIQLEMMLTSWRNHFTCDVFAEAGSAHIESLCKWGPSRFTIRKRILPSGRPPEESVTLIESDPTWQQEYQHFCHLCENGMSGNLQNDIWLNQQLRKLANQAGVPSVLPETGEP